MKRLFTVFLSACVGTVASAQVSSLDEVKTDCAYIIYNPYYTTYAVYNAQKSTMSVWVAGMASSY